MAQVAVIILNWNAAADTIRCVQKLTGWTRLEVTIWVVDNASTDGSDELIARECPQVRLIRNSTNRGYAGGNNSALVEVLAQGDGPILLLNNDALVAESDIIRLLDTLREQPQIGFVGPLLYDAEQQNRLLAAGGRNIVFHLTSHHASVTTDEPVKMVDYIPGTVMLGRAEAFRCTGLLDEAYFFSGEIPDLCQRGKANGYLSAVETRAKAFHAVQRSSGLRKTLYAYYIVRNRFLFIRKFYRWSRPFLYGFWSWYSLALAGKLQLGGQAAPARAVRLGLTDGLRGRFGGQNERVLATVARQVDPGWQ